jgi:hypothetical protein
VSVRSDKAVYKNGERVKISGRAVNATGEAGATIIDIRIARKDPGGDLNWREPVFRTVLIATMPEFSDETYTIQLPESGNPFWGRWIEFGISVEAAPHGDPHANWELARTSFGVQEIGYIWLAAMVGLPGLFMVASISGCLWGCMHVPRKASARLILWVIYCSALGYLAIALLGPLLISLSPGTEAFFRTTPVGFAKVVSEKIKEPQWAINIGGVVSGDVVKGGFVVPLFVLVFGMVGGVINMFRKLPEFLGYYHAIRADDGDVEAAAVSALHADVFRYFVYIITGPFLAIAMYCLLALADFTNPLVLSVVALSVGFRSDKIVEWMLEFTGTYVERARQRDAGSAGSEQGPPAAAGDGVPATTAAAIGGAPQTVQGNGAAVTATHPAPVDGGVKPAGAEGSYAPGEKAPSS